MKQQDRDNMNAFMKKRRELLVSLMQQKSKEEVIEIAMYFACMGLTLGEHAPIELQHHVIDLTVSMLGLDVVKRVSQFLDDACKTASICMPKPSAN